MNTNYDLTKYVDKLYSPAIKKTENTHIAEDITQEAFLAATAALWHGKYPDNVRA